MGADTTGINVDELFETHSIAEIDQIQKKLLAEVEKKREELRTMVGERYRDLLKAADAIDKMKDTSSSVVNEIVEITSHCKNLHEKHLIGFKTYSNQSELLQNKQLNTYFSTVFQIKLLTSLPEMIWSHLDADRYFVATQLFIFSRHISTGLKLDMDNNFIKYFPVARKQWEILKPFYFTIKEISATALEKESVSKELACDCLLALYLLEKCSLEDILSNFLQLRTKAYLDTLQSDHGTKRRVKERILASLKVLNSTVELIQSCFSSKGTTGLIFQELEKLSDASAPPTITLMNLNDTDLIYILPDIIAKFQPSFEPPVLPVETIRQKVENWYKLVSDAANSQLKSLFDLVSSMKTLQEIQKQSLELENVAICNKLGEELSLPTRLVFYRNLYKPLLNTKTREIIRQSWSDCVNSTFNEIDQLIKSDQNNRLEETQSFLWADELGDLPLSLKKTLNQDKRRNKLLMKVKGYSEDIIKICSSFDDGLEVILNDVNYFLEGNACSSEEKQDLIEFVRSTSYEETRKFIEMIKSEESNLTMSNFIQLANILRAFIELCQNLRNCLTYTQTDINWEKSSNVKSSSSPWYQSCKLFEEESFRYWKLFCDAFLEKIPILKWMNRNIEYQVILQDFLNWDTISIEERDEHDNPVQSVIKVPSQIRISLQTYLFEVISALNVYAPQTLPPKVLLYFDSMLLRELLQYYTNLLDKQHSPLNQNTALQLYFDLKFLQLIFITRDDKKEQETVQKLTNTLKSNIDPFDFELFHTHLITNVKKCALRMQYQLGTILPHPESIGKFADLKQSMSSQDKDPNVLCISCNGSTSTWFPLLPIIVPGRQTLGTTETEKVTGTKPKKPPIPAATSDPSSKQQTSPQTAQTYASNVKSGAAAFFGAMSQDWFR